MSHYSTVGIAISTHGDKDKVLYVRDEIMYVNDFVDPIKRNKTLNKKPKVRKNLKKDSGEK